MQYWLMKSEPHELSIADLMERRTARWDGVRGYEARNFIRDSMRPNDKVVFYHSGVSNPGPVGLAKIASAPYPDPTQFDSQSPYYDNKSTQDAPRWVAIDVEAVRQFKEPISRQEMRVHPKLEHMLLWKKFRLSITPLTKEEYEHISVMGLKHK
jgi:predicted RNA-binding protein with PUA-like domain